MNIYVHTHTTTHIYIHYILYRLFSLKQSYRSQTIWFIIYSLSLNIYAGSYTKFTNYRKIYIKKLIGNTWIYKKIALPKPVISLLMISIIQSLQLCCSLQGTRAKHRLSQCSRRTSSGSATSTASHAHELAQFEVKSICGISEDVQQHIWC